MFGNDGSNIENLEDRQRPLEYSIQAALGSKKWVLLPIVSFLLATYNSNNIRLLIYHLILFILKNLPSDFDL